MFSLGTLRVDNSSIAIFFLVQRPGLLVQFEFRLAAQVRIAHLRSRDVMNVLEVVNHFGPRVPRAG